jgi:hypothetical protein
MRYIGDMQYTQFNPIERTELTMAALSRGDEVEANRLWDTCPKVSYLIQDVEYSSRVQCLSLLGHDFFYKCVFLYNQTKRIDELLNEYKIENLYLENKSLGDDKSMEPLVEVRKLYISRLKALYGGFKEFCDANKLNSDNILKTLKIENCCHSINTLLSCDIPENEEYQATVKIRFQDMWRF